MEVTLRKAHSLAQSLLTAARSLPLSKEISISIYSGMSVHDEITTARNKLESNAEKAIALIQSAFEIRGAINKVNASSNINALLTEKNSLDSAEKILSSIVASATASHGYFEDDSNPERDLKTVQNRIEALRNRQANGQPSDRYGSIQESLSVSVLSDGVTNKFQDELANIRRKKVAIADELLSTNMTKKITLTVDTVRLLEEFKIV